MTRARWAIVFLLPLGWIAACQKPTAEPVKAAVESPVERGAYLVSILGCDDCHTPKTMTPQGPVPDTARRLAGHWSEPPLPEPPKLPTGPWDVMTTMGLSAWSGPWGVSYAINLTPDENTGFGIWTEEMFVKAIRTGKHMGQSRPILPPMPVQIFKHMTDDDLKAVFAFLKTLPPIRNQVPDAVIAPAPAGS